MRVEFRKWGPFDMRIAQQAKLILGVAVEDHFEGKKIVVCTETEKGLSELVIIDFNPDERTWPFT